MAPLTRQTSLSMALTFAGSYSSSALPLSTPSRASSTRRDRSGTNTPTQNKMNAGCGTETGREFSLYKGISDRPLGWKARRKAKPSMGQAARNANSKRWDGDTGTTSEWDRLRRDPELWYEDGDCYIHLYGQGQSRRGPSFRLPFDTLLEAECRPLIDRFLAQDSAGSPVSDLSSYEERSYFDERSSAGRYDLYIPVPQGMERGQAMHHHIGTRNFFAWMFGKPIVGSRLGGTLVELLDRMTEYRAVSADNVQDILDYMDDAGYADMRSQPDYALAMLYFAEHFQFRDIWIDAYAHCTGMNEMLFESTELEHVSRSSRAAIGRGRLEMEIRLERCGQSMSTFLEDELSTSHVGLSAGARAHLDRFRSFLQAYYVEKLGYYPPTFADEYESTFPKDIYEVMAAEFQDLYDFLVDEKFTTSDCSPVPVQGGICVLQNIQAFDRRHRQEPLPHPLPLMPELPTESSRVTSKRMTWAMKSDKLKPNEDLVTLSALAKATNRHKAQLMRSPLVKAYRGFEKDCIFPTANEEKNRVSLADARKVRWIMVYAILQTLLSATKVPVEVRDTEDVPYSLCVRTTACPSWLDENVANTSPQTPSILSEQYWDDYSMTESPVTSVLSTPLTHESENSIIKPDIDYFQLNHRASSVATTPTTPTVQRKGTIRRALSTLGNMPELRHPKPVRNSFHEILVHGYGNGLNAVSLAMHPCLAPAPLETSPKTPNDSISSEDSSENGYSPTWSNSDGGKSPTSSISDYERRDSDASLKHETVVGAMEKTSLGAEHTTSILNDRNDMALQHLQPEPLKLSPRRRESLRS